MKIFETISKHIRQYNCIGRLFWSVTLIMSFCGMSIFCFYTFQKYFSEPVSMTLETEFTNWNFAFPAVSVCFVKGRNSASISAIVDSLNITYSGSRASLTRLIHKCMFENTLKQNSDILEKCDEIETKYGLDLGEFRKMSLPSDCKQFVDSLFYDGTELEDCSDFMKFHRTELGYCFILNSISDTDLSFEKLKLKYTFSTKVKQVTIRLRHSKIWQYTFQVFSNEDMPFFYSMSTDITPAGFLLSYDLEEVITDEDASKKSVSQRGCRFPHEKLEGSPFHYSFSTCMSFLRIQMEFRECNCTHSSSPDFYRSRYCDLQGNMCLVKENINSKFSYQVMKENICVPGCREQVLNFAGKTEMEVEKSGSNTTDVSFEVLNTPIVRYKRSVIRTKLDLAVSIAGLAGLFFGASVLNLVEILYFFLSTK